MAPLDSNHCPPPRCGAPRHSACSWLGDVNPAAPRSGPRVSRVSRPDRFSEASLPRPERLEQLTKGQELEGGVAHGRSSRCDQGKAGMRGARPLEFPRACMMHMIIMKASLS